MKKIVFVSLFAIALGAVISSCDKVDNPYPAGGSGELDWSLYPDGDSAHYAQNQWPVFTPNPNTQRFVLIEDFTGHQCPNCPNTATAVHNKIATDPTRIFGAAIHAGPTVDGMTSFQEITPPNYVEEFFNPDGLAIGAFLGNISGGFIGNPRITINRVAQAGDVTCTAASLNTLCSNILSSQLKVNIQAETNYFPSTRGLFLHTEVDKIDASVTNDLALVVYVIEDSMIAYQKNSGGDIPDYEHEDIMRGCIDGKPLGRTLDASDMINGKYYCNYSYKVPNELEIDNMHLIIYVYDKVTYEIYQVIKHEL